ncbi:MAG: FixH family protein, partial [Rhodospirillaceae bacterium]|nr:FixH family protein [Rhodospirillaceae bacterium]
HYNQTLDAQRKQDALGWKVDLNYGSDGDLLVRFVDSSGLPLDDLNVSANLYRPSQDNVDYSVSLQSVSAGGYRAKLNLPLSGLWEVRLSANRDSDTFHLRRRIQAP